MNRKITRTSKHQAFLNKLGANIRKVRRTRGYSTDRVHLESGLSRATMTRIERGIVDAQAFTLKRIADTLGVPLKKLFDFE